MVYNMSKTYVQVRSRFSVRVAATAVDSGMVHFSFIIMHFLFVRFICTKVVSAERTTFIFHCVKIFFAAKE